MTTTINDARFWDRIAPKYARGKISDIAGYERTLERTISHLRADDHALEIGCGTGSTALRLAPHLGHLIATDISGEMVAIARDKALAANITNLHFEKAAADEAGKPGSDFDVVFAFNALHMLDDLPRHLRAMHDMIAPGGLFISKTPCLGDMNPLIRLAVPVLQFFGKAPFVNSFTGAQLEAAIETAGFTIIEREFHASKGKDTRPFIVARRA
jgi:ubiquinone/menaquinone biosynthesis C-methylase UbiE